MCTVYETLNRGHVGASYFVLCSEIVHSSNCIWYDYAGFYPVGGAGGSFPPNVACCEPYIALNASLAI